MKTLKVLSILGLVIILIGFTACDKGIKNPYGPDIPNPNDPSTRYYTAEVNYTGEPVTAKTDPPLLEMTLNRVWVADKLQDKDLGGWYYPDGKYVIVELKAKNVDSGSYGPLVLVCWYMFSLVDGNGNSYPSNLGITSYCFSNPLEGNLIYPNQEMPLKVLVFDIPENATGLTLVFHYEPTTHIIYIKFNIQTI